MTRVSIREEEPADVDAIRRHNEMAFGRADEARLVALVRAHRGIMISYREEFSTVA
jgi:predicted N-acetyltransferase YhbS